MIGNDKRWMNMDGLCSWFCFTGVDSESQIVEGRFLIKSKPVEQTGLHCEILSSIEVDANTNDPSWVDNWREAIVSTSMSTCSESGANKDGSARCNSSSSFSLAWSWALRKVNTFEISCWKKMYSLKLLWSKKSIMTRC